MPRFLSKNLAISVGAACAFLALGICVVIGSFLISFENIYPQFSGLSGTTDKTRVFYGAELIPVSVARYSTRDSQAIIEEFADDQAILASRAALSLRQYPFVEVSVRHFSAFLNAKLVWQGKTGTASQSATLTLSLIHI